MYAYFDSVHFYRLIMEKARESIKKETETETDHKTNNYVVNNKIKVENGVSNYNVEFQITFFFEQLICNIESNAIQFEDIQDSRITLAEFKSLFLNYSLDDLKECIQIINDNNDNKDESLDVSFSFSNFRSFCLKLERNVLRKLLSCIYYPTIRMEVANHLYKSKNYETYKSNEIQVVRSSH